MNFCWIKGRVQTLLAGCLHARSNLESSGSVFRIPRAGGWGRAALPPAALPGAELLPPHLEALKPWVEPALLELLSTLFPAEPSCLEKQC